MWHGYMYMCFCNWKQLYISKYHFRDEFVLFVLNFWLFWYNIDIVIIVCIVIISGLFFVCFVFLFNFLLFWCKILLYIGFARN